MTINNDFSEEFVSSIPPDNFKQNFSYRALERIVTIMEENILGDDFVEGVTMFLQETDIEPEFFIKNSDDVIKAKLTQAAIKHKKIRKCSYGNNGACLLDSFF